jgi:heme oxygenase
MFSGQITNPEYAIYLKQQYESYGALEERFNKVKPDSGVEFPDERIKRADNIFKDLLEMDENGDSLPILPSTLSYCDYIKTCPDDMLYAHVYVRYLGDLKGGQMISKRVPGSGFYYKFEDPEQLEVSIRSKLREDDSFVEECKKCFTFATDSFNDIKAYIDSNLDI